MRSKEISSTPEAEYKNKLGELFSRRRAGYVKFAETLLLKRTIIPETSDRLEIAKDIVQNTFLDLLKSRILDFSLSDDAVESFCTQSIVWEVKKFIVKYYQYRSNNPKKVPENKYERLGKALGIVVPPEKLPVDLESLIDSVKNITDLQKTILKSHFVEDKTKDEIATEQGLNSHQSVDGHINAALVKLKKNPHFKNLLN